MKYALRLCLLVGVLLLTAACNMRQTEEVIEDQNVVAQQATREPTETLPPFTPLPSLTPSQTLRPPPTLEPPTLTPSETPQPSPTVRPTLDLTVSLPELRGLNTPTLEGGATAEGGCQVREDWALFYEVRAGDALASIAAAYNTFVSDLVEANCLEDPDVLQIGQKIRVPGEAHPITPEFVCTPWELLTPFNGTILVPGSGLLNFNWRGPEAPRYLVRIWRGRDTTQDWLLELPAEFTENVDLDLSRIPEEGEYSWQVVPLNQNFQQIPCKESHFSVFRKDPAPPTPDAAVPDPQQPTQEIVP